MNILLMTNTYSPHVGGVAKSVDAFAGEFRRLGHRVMIIAPEFPGMPVIEENILRVPAIRHFNHTDFSVRLPVVAHMQDAVEAFQPNVIHSQHPFMLGDSALRLASRNGVPIVFTHHTLYERYTHYVPGDGEALKHIVAEIATGYANLCDRVFAPSASLAKIIRERGVTTPIDVVPTGVEVDQFEAGSGNEMRDFLGIPQDVCLIGHVGRLAPEKNLDFLVKCVSKFMATNPNVHFLLVGSGPSLEGIVRQFERCGLSDRIHIPGTLSGPSLVNAYKAMNVFVFASQTETQGMVLTEAMAASTPVIAVDATGVRDVIQHGKNGYLLDREDENKFVGALNDYVARAPDHLEEMRRTARSTARALSIEVCALKALRGYEEAIEAGSAKKYEQGSPWSRAIDRVRTEWELLANTAGAVGSTMIPGKRKPV